MLHQQTFVKWTEAMPVAVDTSGLPIGMALRVERVTAKATTTAVAVAVGISIGHLSRIESGDRTASDDLVKRIRDAIRSIEESRAA